MRRQRKKIRTLGVRHIADFRGDLTCLIDTQLRIL
jgi:hypothetical protein